jgi:hypothetical protein
MHVCYTKLICSKLYKCFENAVEQADFKNINKIKLTGVKYAL